MSAAQRQRLIKLVHVGKRELGMSMDAYRDTLQAITGKRSASDLSALELERVLGKFKAAGFKVKGQPEQRRPAATPLAHKIRALWAELHQVGKVRDPSAAALDLWIKRETKIEALAWLDVATAGGVVERLKKWLER